jgi:hypothetical protein
MEAIHSIKYQRFSEYVGINLYRNMLRLHSTIRSFVTCLFTTREVHGSHIYGNRDKKMTLESCMYKELCDRMFISENRTYRGKNYNVIIEISAGFPQRRSR